jgi:fructose-1,6-bisphosphatase I
MDIETKKTVNKIVNLIRDACQKVSHHIRHSNPTDLSKLVGDDNISGDHIKLLDQLSQNYLFDYLRKCPDIYGIISEEHDDIYKTNHPEGKFFVAFDPLDGSSNIEFNITTGTIFAIYKLNDKKQIDSGRNIVSSGYCLYGGVTEFVYTDIIDNDCIKMFRLNDENKVPQLIEDNIVMPSSGKYYSINQAYQHLWFQSDITTGLNILSSKGYSLRYVGSMVADCHRVILKGGLFMYPCDKKNHRGKIRLYYEAYPFAFLAEKAGGMATDFYINILDISAPSNIHATTPIIIGSKTEVILIMDLISISEKNNLESELESKLNFDWLRPM